MNPITSVVKMHLRDKWMWVYVPWIILLSSFIVNYILSIFIDAPIYTGGLSSIYIYMLVMGILTLVQTFPFAIGFSIRRTDFFLGTSLMVFLVSIVTAIILLSLSVIEGDGGWGTGLYFFHLPYITDGSILEQLWIHFVLMVFMFFLGFFIVSVYRRFSRIGLLIFFILLSMVFAIISYICTNNNWWGNIGDWIIHRTAFEITLWLLPFALCYVLFSYLLLRRATV